MADMIRKQDESARQQEPIYQQNRELARMHIDRAIGQVGISNHVLRLNERLTIVKAELAQIKADVAQIQTNVVQIKADGVGMSEKLDIILAILHGQNGH